MDAVVSRREPLPSFPMMVLMLGLLSCVAPATIDAYLPPSARWAGNSPCRRKPCN
ncbi:MAG: hypothetical protein PBV54_15465 [Achromobacter xylosoxidans]